MSDVGATTTVGWVAIGTNGPDACDRTEVVNVYVPSPGAVTELPAP